MYYCSLAEARKHVGTQKVSGDATLLDMVWFASRRIDLEIGSEDVPFFAPYKAIRQLLIEPQRVNSYENTFRFNGFLLELISATLGGTALTLDTDVVAHPPGASPIRALRLKGVSTCRTWYDRGSLEDGEPLTAIVSGIWGYRSGIGRTWKKVATLSTSIDADDTSVVLSSIAAVSPGHLIRMVSGGVAEYMTVETVPTSGTTIVVEREANGTDAAAHTAGIDVEVFQVEDTIRRVVARQAGLMLGRTGAYETRQADGMGAATVYPSDLLAELQAVLQGYANV